jgi:hypothetical protein
LGFHIALNGFSFSVLTGLGLPRQGPMLWAQKNLKVRIAARFRFGDPVSGR